MFMNELFSQSNVFRSSDYLVTHDIDMHQVAYDAYQQAPFGFSGHFSSSVITSQTILYDRTLLQNGNTNYHSIIGLQINYGTSIGRYYSYGLFAFLFGTVEHINFIDAKVNTLDAHLLNEQKEVMIGLISGAVGGNVAGGVMKNLNQGTLVNSIAGIVGGGLGGQILGMLGAGGGAGGLDVASILTQVAGGGIGGGAVLAIVGVVKNMMAK